MKSREDFEKEVADSMKTLESIGAVDRIGALMGTAMVELLLDLRDQNDQIIRLLKAA